jgi:filamentous hemagglutinin family protein
VSRTGKKWLDARLLLGTAAIALIVSPVAHANPKDGSVTTGSAAISASSSKTTVDQKSEGVVIDWSSFNIGAGQTTQFVQPNSSALAVNRIGGASASQILGTLDANGRVVLINGNGVLFGKNSQVNVGSLIATTTDGSDSDVLAGKFTKAGNQNASVVNNGAITAAGGGVVALVAPNVTNTGTVNAKLGTVALGAANKFTVDFSGDGLVSFAAQGDVNARASAINSGLLSGANVSMTAHAANGIATGIVSMSGIVTAQGVRDVGGTIYLDAGNGTLTTTGTLNAAGATGGGNIETSGRTANISGHITAGQSGRWKVDPEDLTIDSNAATTIDGALNAGTSVLEQTTSGAASGSGNQTSGEGDINVDSALSWASTATLTLDSYHSININAPITILDAGGLTLLTNDNGGSGGALNFAYGPTGFTGNVAFTDVVSGATQGSLAINGHSYTLENNIGGMESDISFNPGGYFALANFLDASGDGTLASALISSFSGTFEGLGNTISNLKISANTAPNDEGIGLFSYVTGNISDLAVSGGSVTGNVDVGALTGSDLGNVTNVHSSMAVTGFYQVGGLIGDSQGIVSNSSSSGTVTGQLVDLSSGGEPSAIGGLIGEVDSGSVTGSYATGNVTALGGDYIGGLIGYTLGNNNVTVSNSYATGNVDAGFDSSTFVAGVSVGGLIGDNAGAVIDSYATGSVLGTQNVGGLIGLNENDAPGTSVSNPTGDGTVVNSFATGAVTGYVDTFGNEGIDVGGLIGYNEGAVANAYSMGPVIGGDQLGGIVGTNTGSLYSVYSTGLVQAAAGATPLEMGGLVGEDDGLVSIQNAYWDTETSGIANPSQGAGNIANDSGITGETTANLQGTLPTGFDNTIWSTGPNLFPYFLWQYPSGAPQSISGTAYTDAGVTADAGDAILGLLDGNAIGSVTSGANGYYYFLLAPGSLGGADAVYVQSSTGATVADDLGASRAGVDIWGNYFSDLTAESFLSSAGNNVVTALGGNVAANTFASNLVNQDIISSASSFSVDAELGVLGDTTVKTTNGDLYVIAGQDWSTSGTLTLDSAGSIYMRQPIEIDTGANLALVTSDGGTGNLAFQGGNVFFTDLTSTLTINGQGYTLVPDIATLAGDIATTPSGYYALADNYDASVDGTYAQAAVPTTLTGTFEGLGNTIINLTIDDTGGGSIGLFAQIGSTGVVRDIGLLNVAFTGGNGNFEGALAGVNYGAIFGSFANGSVASGFGTRTGGLVGFNSGGTISQSFANDAVQAQAGSDLGGFVGYNSGTISQSYASGAVTSENTNAVGGFVGYNQGAIAASYSTGAVSAQGTSTSTQIGGFAGENDTGGTIDESYVTGAVSPGAATTFGAFASANNGTIGGTTADYYDTGVNPGMAAVGGGTGTAPGLSGLIPSQFLNSANFTGWTFGTAGSGADWVIVDNNGTLDNSTGATGGTLPFLTMEYSTEISNEHQLQLMSLDLREAYILVGNVAYDGAMWSVKGFVPVGGSGSEFEGTFGGQGYTISNLTIDRPTQDYVGLFGLACDCTDISYVTLSGGSVTGADYVGALVGASSGSMTFDVSDVNVTGYYNPSSPTTGLYIGGLVGYYDGSGLFESSSSGAVRGYGDVGGLIGQADFFGIVQSVQASGNVHGVESVGGLIGASDGVVTDGYATGNVTGTGRFIGGLIGFNDNDGEIFDSSASGIVSGAAEVGGFVGTNSGSIDQSFATGPASGSFQVGGFVGDNAVGSLVQDSYAMGAAAISGSFAGQNGAVGGFAGENAGEIDHAYSTGMVTCAPTNTCVATLGGFVGQNDGTIDWNSFWDTDTSGIKTQGIGTDNTGGSANVFGETTTTLQSALPSTWDPTVWGIVADVSYPYLQWQTGGLTPQIISGTTLAANGSAVSGLNAGLLVNGTGTAPLADMNSGANGYYYMLLAPGTISNSGSQALVYLTNGLAADAYVQNATKSIGQLTLKEGQLRVRSSASDSASILAGLNTALGSASGADFLYSAGSGFAPGANFLVADTAAAFTLDSSIDLGSGQLTLTTSGTDTQTSGVITASWLRGSSDGGASFDDANEIGALGAFANAGSGGFALIDDETLKVGGALNAGTGGLSLTTTGVGSNIAVNQSITAGGIVTLTSAGTISEKVSSGSITAATLTGSADGAALLKGANEIANLDGFSTTAGSFALTDGQSLTVDGAVNSGTSSLALQVTSGDLDIDDALDGKSVTLGSSTGEVQGAGAITTGFLSVSANTGIDLTGANNIGKIGHNHTNSGPDVINP